LSQQILHTFQREPQPCTNPLAQYVHGIALGPPFVIRITPTKVIIFNSLQRF